MLSKAIIFGIILYCCFSVTYCKKESIATSIAELEEFAELEAVLLKTLEKYADKLKKKLDTVRSIIWAIREVNDKAVKEKEEYLGHALSSFSLIRRLHQDWSYWQLFLETDVGKEEIETIQKLRDDLPNAEYLSEAANGIHRIQLTYDIKPADFALGFINKIQYNVSLSSLDCFAIGVELLDKKHFYDSSFWLYIGLQLFRENEIFDILNFKRTKILEMYGEAMLQRGRTKDSLSIFNVALKSKPEDVRIKNKIAEIELMLKSDVAEWIPDDPVRDTSSYVLGCRGAFANSTSRLHCVYNTTTSPFLRLAPLKMEQLSIDPYIVLYHNVTSDAEAESLKRMARPVLRRAMVYDDKKNRNQPSDQRTSSFAWFTDNSTELTKTINKRIEDMTGFDLYGSEMLQVMNYGIGGHYATHHDYFNLTENSTMVRMQGDRISTVLFYLSDVEQGGATIFPSLKLAVQPVKGTAVVWYNLNDKSEPVFNTMHAACPVIVGSKWVCNKWIRTKQQMFRKPCYK